MTTRGARKSHNFIRVGGETISNSSDSADQEGGRPVNENIKHVSPPVRQPPRKNDYGSSPDLIKEMQRHIHDKHRLGKKMTIDEMGGDASQS